MGFERVAVVEGRDAMLALERPRLVRLCAHLAGDTDAAEDLAQETLLEAWRHGHKLREGEGHAPWLSAIARHVCRRWARARARDETHGLRPRSEGENLLSAPDDDLADGFDLEVALERDELAALLDRALGLLPPETRLALVQKYIQDYPQAEIAARLGMSTGAIELRLHRGKLALRRLLTTDLRQEALRYGLLDAGSAAWQETCIWCPVCGQRRLAGRSFAHHGEFRLRCPGCFPAYHSAPALNIGHASSAEVLGGVTAFKPALSRIMADWDSFFKDARAGGQVTCPACGHAAALRMGFGPLLPDWPATLSTRGVHWWCERCGAVSNLHLLSLTLYGPIGRRFWRAHPRIRMLPEREIEFEGRPALLTRFESVTDGASLDVVSARDTYEVLRVDSTPHV